MMRTDHHQTFDADGNLLAEEIVHVDTTLEDSAAVLADDPDSEAQALKDLILALKDIIGDSDQPASSNSINELLNYSNAEILTPGNFKAALWLMRNIARQQKRLARTVLRAWKLDRELFADADLGDPT